MKVGISTEISWCGDSLSRMCQQIPKSADSSATAARGLRALWLPFWPCTALSPVDLMTRCLPVILWFILWEHSCQPVSWTEFSLLKKIWFEILILTTQFCFTYGTQINIIVCTFMIAILSEWLCAWVHALPCSILYSYLDVDIIRCKLSVPTIKPYTERNVGDSIYSKIKFKTKIYAKLNIRVYGIKVSLKIY